jgi:predicted P-loop ATPase/GTPase
MNVDIEIYMNNIIKFFKENPNDLLNLVPKTKEEEFYSKLREVVNQNYEKGEEVNLTKNQIIIICAEIHGKTKKVKEETPKTIDEMLNDSRTIEKLIINTPFGNYSLN